MNEIEEFVRRGLAAQVAADDAIREHTAGPARGTDRVPAMSYRIRYRVLGGHVHARFWSSEFGPATTHGANGTLTFRIGRDWDRFKSMLSGGAKITNPLLGVVEFIDDTEQDPT